MDRTLNHFQWLKYLQTMFMSVVRSTEIWKTFIVHSWQSSTLASFSLLSSGIRSGSVRVSTQAGYKDLPTIVTFNQSMKTKRATPKYQTQPRWLTWSSQMRSCTFIFTRERSLCCTSLRNFERETFTLWDLLTPRWVTASSSENVASSFSSSGLPSCSYW